MTWSKRRRRALRSVDPPTCLRHQRDQFLAKVVPERRLFIRRESVSCWSRGRSTGANLVGIHAERLGLEVVITQCESRVERYERSVGQHPASGLPQVCRVVERSQRYRVASGVVPRLQSRGAALECESARYEAGSAGLAGYPMTMWWRGAGAAHWVCTQRAILAHELHNSSPIGAARVDLESGRADAHPHRRFIYGSEMRPTG